MMKAWLLAAPAVLTLLFLFLVPLGLVVGQSLGYQAVDGSGGLSLIYWQRALRDPELVPALILSLRLAATSTLIAVPAGLLLAVGLHASVTRYPLLSQAVRFPIVVPHLTAGCIVLLLLGRTGWLSRLLYAAGIISAPEQFPVLVHDAAGWGIIAAYVWKEAPFVALLVFPLLTGALRTLQEAARTLGASPLQVMRYVVVPLTWPALASGAVIIFAYSFGAFELPFLLGRTYPRALPVLAYQRYISPDLTERPEAMVISLVLALVAVGAALSYLLSLRRMEQSLLSVRSDPHG